MQVQPYLSFEGRCEEALNFYAKAIGAKVEMLMRFKDAPPSDGPAPEGCANPPANSDEKVMHSSFRIGDTVLMATDADCNGKPNFQGISLALSLKTEADVDRVFAGLSEGGKVQVPPMKTFFSAKFGIVADKFGVSWMVLVA